MLCARMRVCIDNDKQRTLNNNLTTHSHSSGKFLQIRPPHAGEMIRRGLIFRAQSSVAVAEESLMESLMRTQGERVWQPLTRYPAPRKAPVVSSSGCVLHKMDGSSALDMLAGLWCVNVGYGRKELADVAHRAMLELPYHAPTMASPSQIELADKICVGLDGHFARDGHVYFTTTGSEANETAFKIARQYHGLMGNGQRYKIISRHRGYHGNTAAALAATGQMERKFGYGPEPEGFVKVPPPYAYRCDDDAEAHARRLEETIISEGIETVAAVLAEPIISGGGVLVPPYDYLPLVRRVCDKYGILLILDEVVSGFGRTGKFFAHHHYDEVNPDMVTMAKGLTSGYMPLGAVATSSKIFEAFQLDRSSAESTLPPRLAHFRNISTFCGHPVSCAVALRNLEVIEREGLIDVARNTGDYLYEALHERLARNPFVGDIRSRGLLVGIELVKDRTLKTPLSDVACAAVVEECAQNGVVVGRNHTTVPGYSNVIIMAPPFIVSREECQTAIDILAAAIDNVPP